MRRLYVNQRFVDQRFFFWHWLPALLSRQEIVVRGAPYPMDVGVSYRNKPFWCVDLAPRMWFLFQLYRQICINIHNFLSAFATITFRLSPCVVVVVVLRFFLGLTFVMIRTTHAVRRAFWLSVYVNQRVFTPFEFSLSTKIIPARLSTWDCPSTSLF